MNTGTVSALTLVLLNNHQEGETPLHHAAEKGEMALVQLLLDYAADPTLRDAAGRAPLHWACSSLSHAPDMVAALLDANCDINVKDEVWIRFIKQQSQSITSAYA